MNTMVLVWLGAIVLFAVVEALTVGLVSVWFVLGSLVAFVLALCHVGLAWQVGAFIVVSVAALFGTRPLVKKWIKPKQIPTNANMAVGQLGVVQTAINNLSGEGRVLVMGLDWSARSVDGTPIPAGTEVLVKEIQGVKLLVEAAVELAGCTRQ